MRNKLRTSNIHLLRLAIWPDNGYTPLKINEQNVENNARRYEYLGGNNPTWKIPKRSSLVVVVKLKVK